MFRALTIWGVSPNCQVGTAGGGGLPGAPEDAIRVRVAGSLPFGIGLWQETRDAHGDWGVGGARDGGFCMRVAVFLPTGGLAWRETRDAHGNLGKGLSYS